MAHANVPTNGTVLDVGCGMARALRMLAARFANSRFTGLDLCDDAITAARAEADKAGRWEVEVATNDLSTRTLEALTVAEVEEFVSLTEGIAAAAV